MQYVSRAEGGTCEVRLTSIDGAPVCDRNCEEGGKLAGGGPLVPSAPAGKGARARVNHRHAGVAQPPLTRSQRKVAQVADFGEQPRVDQLGAGAIRVARKVRAAAGARRRLPRGRRFVVPHERGGVVHICAAGGAVGSSPARASGRAGESAPPPLPSADRRMTIGCEGNTAVAFAPCRSSRLALNDAPAHDKRASP
jgi:hypothetical protein